MKNLFLFTLIFVSTFYYSQVGGNQLYQQNGSYNTRYNYNNTNDIKTKQSVRSTDSTIIISANILMTKMADSYLVTLGASQEGKTLVECNTQINSRLSKLTKSLAPLGITANAIYIDFISETKIYDYEQISEKSATQIQTGFEIKKNVIIRLDNLNGFDKLVELCAAQEIYDIIQVEYRNSNVDEVYNQMFDEAMTLIQKRKTTYLKATGQAVKKTSKIITDNFYNLSPKDQYRGYEVSESNKLIYNHNYYNANLPFFTKELRKSKTFFYQSLDHSGFDKVIDNATPQIGVQYVFYIQMEFKVEKEK